MKILAVTKSQGRAREFANKGLKIISRAGYSYKIYLRKEEQASYDEKIFFAKSDHYLFIEPKSIIYLDKVRNIYQETVNQKIVKDAKTNKYELLLYIPDNLSKINGINNLERQLIYFCRQVEAMRSQFQKDKGLLILSDWTIHKELYMLRL